MFAEKAKWNRVQRRRRMLERLLRRWRLLQRLVLDSVRGLQRQWFARNLQGLDVSVTRPGMWPE
jgi:hypothetical protein